MNPLLCDMFSTSPDADEAQRATLTGATAAMFTFLAYPPAAHFLWFDWRQNGQRPDPRPQLIARWVPAVTGYPPQVEGLRRLIAGGGRHADFPDEVDRHRFGPGYRATDPEHLAAVYVIMCELMLAAQEMMHRQLNDAERDAYCAGCAATAGTVLGLGRRAPASYAKLHARYAAIVTTRLQGTSFGAEALTAMLDGCAPAPLPATLTRQAARFVDERTAQHLGLAQALDRAGAVRAL